jgi:predicted DNA-binding protein YlxM (UPF0122 family)
VAQGRSYTTKQRARMVERYEEGYSTNEIARELQVSYSGVYKTLRREKVKMRPTGSGGVIAMYKLRLEKNAK